MADAQNENYEDWITRRRLKTGAVAVTVRVSKLASKQSSIITHDKTTALIREGPDLLGYKHYNAIVEVDESEQLIHRFVLASLSPNDPAVSVGASEKVLFIGSYQTLYGVALPSCEVLFQTELPEGPEVSDVRTLKTHGEDAAVVVSETAIRLVLENGTVRWIAEFEDPVKLIQLTENEAVCQAVVPDGVGNFWKARINLATGESAFIKQFGLPSSL